MKKASPGAITNRRARYDYELGDDLVVGLSLTGAEVKAARLGRVHLKGSYVAIKQNQLWLINASFSLQTNEPGGNHAVDTRDRQLLAHRRQIDQFLEHKKQGLTIVPTKLLTKGKFIKLVVATGRGKKRYDKRQTVKERDLKRGGEL
jgi:SsrA-binding protein